MQKELYALLNAIKKGDRSRVETLLESGVDVNVKEEQKGFTPLMVASAMGNAAIVSLLLEHGADIRLKNNNGLTALELSKNQEVKELLETEAEDAESYAIIDDCDYPVDAEGRIKIEVDSYMESILTGFIVLSSIVTFIPIFPLLEDGFDPDLLKILGGGVFGIVFFGFLRKQVDDYYLADLKNRIVLWHRNWFGFSTLSRVVGFDEILGITVHGKKCSSKHRTWWEYMLVLVTITGKKYQISESEEVEFTEKNRQAEFLANKMGAVYVPGKSEKGIKIVRLSSKKLVIEIVEPGYFSFHWFR
ncbi:ankyrin repeat domain-containing protein [Candidatus Riflebacteria bacterium]